MVHRNKSKTENGTEIISNSLKITNDTSNSWRTIIPSRATGNVRRTEQARGAPAVSLWLEKSSVHRWRPCHARALFFLFLENSDHFFHSLDPLPNTHGCSGQRILETIFHGLASVNELNSCCRAREQIFSEQQPADQFSTLYCYVLDCPTML